MADGSGPARVAFELTAVGRRLAICGQLRGMAREKASASGKLKLRPRAHALLRLLLHGELGGARQTDALYSATEAAALLNGVVEATAGLGDAAKARAALLLNDLKGMAKEAGKPGASPEDLSAPWPIIPSEWLREHPDGPGKDSHALPVVAEARALGALPDGLPAAIAKAIKDQNPSQTLRDADLAALFPEKWAEFLKAKAWRGDAYEGFRRSVSDTEEAARAEWDAATEAMLKLRDELIALGNAEILRRKAVVTETVAGFIAEFTNASDVGAEDALAWVSSSVVITKRAAARLKKLGYPAEQVLADAAEFYRLARGRIEKVVIDSTGDRRANAVGVMDHGTAGRVNLGSEFDKRVLWHELGHHVEADPVAASAARLFIRMRSKDGGKTHRLSKLTGHKGYRADEFAYANGFFHPYVGKVYPWGTTEVFSMGLDSFSDPYLLAHRMAVDPETFEFVTGYMRSPKTALQSLHLAMRQSLREGSEQADASTEALAKSESAKVADFVKSGALPEGYGWDAFRRQEKIHGYLVPQSGGPLYVLSEGKWRHPVTRRLATLYRLYKMEPGGGRVSMASDHYPKTEPEIAKLALAAWRQNGTEPRYDFIASGQFTLEG